MQSLFVALKKLLERFETAAGFHEVTDVNLAADEVSYRTMVIHEGRHHYEIQKGRAIPTTASVVSHSPYYKIKLILLVEYSLTYFLSFADGFSYTLHRSWRGLWSLQEATIFAYNVLSSILGSSIEFWAR
jgi:hypothetical protein